MGERRIKPADRNTARQYLDMRLWLSVLDVTVRCAYRADGAYGQITTVLPKQGLVVAVQCPESGDFDNVMRPALHEHLFGR